MSRVCVPAAPAQVPRPKMTNVRVNPAVVSWEDLDALPAVTAVSAGKASEVAVVPVYSVGFFPDYMPRKQPGCGARASGGHASQAA